jgi:hypothetical protein
VWSNFTDVSEESIASIFTVEEWAIREESNTDAGRGMAGIGSSSSQLE